MIFEFDYKMTQKELETKIKLALTSKNEYETIAITRNIQLWTQKYNKNEICIELQFKEDCEKDFGETFINLSYLDTFKRLSQNILYYAQKFEELGFDKFIEEFCE